MAREYRDAAITRANEMARGRPDDEEVEGTDYEEEEVEETDNEEAEETDDEDVGLESQGTIRSFAYETTETTISSLVNNGGSNESETSTDEPITDSGYMPPPIKRSSSKSHRPHRGKRRIG